MQTQTTKLEAIENGVAIGCYAITAHTEITDKNIDQLQDEELVYYNTNQIIDSIMKNKSYMLDTLFQESSEELTTRRLYVLAHNQFAYQSKDPQCKSTYDSLLSSFHKALCSKMPTKKNLFEKQLDFLNMLNGKASANTKAPNALNGLHNLQHFAANRIERLSI